MCGPAPWGLASALLRLLQLLPSRPLRRSHPRERFRRLPPLLLRAVSKPVCAICFVQLLPDFGFMKPGPGGTTSGAPPEAVAMER